MQASLTPVFASPIAHRGLHDRANGVIENTRPAFAAAIAGGFGMECDLQPSLDGEAMVFHDPKLDRLTSTTGPIAARNARELRMLTLNDTGAKIESLTDLLQQVAGAMPLVVELKSLYDGNTCIAARVAECVRDYAGPLVLKSFDPAMILALRKANVKQPLGIVAMGKYDDAEYEPLSREQKHAFANLLHFSETRPDFLSWHHKDLPSAAPFLCRTQLGLPVMSWTIRSPEDARRVAPHIDQIVFEGFRPT